MHKGSLLWTFSIQKVTDFSGVPDSGPPHTPIMESAWAGVATETDSQPAV